LTRETTREQRDRWSFLALVLAPVTMGLLVSTLRVLRSVPKPYELEYGEGLVIWFGKNALHLRELYHSIANDVFVVCMYPPVHFLAVWTLEKVVGDFQMAGRLVGLLAFLGLLTAVAAIAFESVPRRWGVTPRWSAALVAAGLTAGCSTISGFAPVVRVDGLGLFLSMAGVAVFLRSPKAQTHSYIAFVFFALAMFTKQTFVAAPAACFVTKWLLDRRAAMQLACFLALLVGGVGAALTWITHGQFLVHLFVYTRNGFALSQLKTFLVPNVGEMVPLLAISGTAISWSWLPVLFGRSGNPRRVSRGRLRTNLSCLLCYSGFAFLVSLTLVKVGAAPYYLMEWNATSAVLVGVMLGVVVARWPLMAERGTAVLVGLTIALVAAVSISRNVSEATAVSAHEREFDAGRRDEFEKTVAWIRQTPGPVIAYDTTVLVKSGKSLSFEPFIMFQLERIGVWDATPFIRDLTRHKYAAIVMASELTNDGWMSDSVRRTMANAYRLDHAIGHNYIYVPVSASIEHRPNGS